MTRRAGPALCRAQLTPTGYAAEYQALLEDLQADGLLLDTRPRRRDREPESPLVPIQGKPLSETVIEERR